MIAAVSEFASSVAGPHHHVGPRIAPASVGQASLWSLQQVMPYKSTYNVAVQMRLAGEVDANVLAACVREIVRRHESCRTTFVNVDGVPCQAIWVVAPADVAIVDVTMKSDPAEEARRLACAAASEPFDLERGPLLRVRILRLGRADHALVLVMHHIVVDGMSLGIWWREIEALYPALRAGLASPLPAPRRQFADCMEAQSAWLRTPAFAGQLDQWVRQLAGAAPCDVPGNRPRPAAKSYRGGLVCTRIPEALLQRLRDLSADERVSLFTTLLAAIDVLLARYSSQDEITTLVPFASRDRYDGEGVMGYFANLVVVRSSVESSLPFRVLLKQVCTEVMGCLRRQDTPFEKVVGRLRPDRSLSSDPVASVGVSFLPTASARLTLPGVTATFEELPNGGSKFDLHFFLTEGASDLTCSLEYNSDILDAEAAQNLLKHYKLLLECVTAAPGVPVAELPLIAPEERHQVLVEWNATTRDYADNRAIHEVFEAQVDMTPGAIAVVFEDQTLTYGELDERANQVAHVLRRRGVGPDVLVGVCMERSIELIVGLYSVLKAGGAYIPLDPGYPKDRLALVLNDARPSVILTQPHLAGILPGDTVDRAEVLTLTADLAEFGAESKGRLDRNGLTLGSLAYVIYTSGSTGSPKGAMNAHRGIQNRLFWMQRTFLLGPSDRVLQKTPFSFDVSVWELFWPLMFGAG